MYLFKLREKIQSNINFAVNCRGTIEASNNLGQTYLILLPKKRYKSAQFTNLKQNVTDSVVFFHIFFRYQASLSLNFEVCGKISLATVPHWASTSSNTISSGDEWETWSSKASASPLYSRMTWLGGDSFCNNISAFIFSLLSPPLFLSACVSPSFSFSVCLFPLNKSDYSIINVPEGYLQVRRGGCCWDR